MDDKKIMTQEEKNGKYLQVIMIAAVIMAVIAVISFVIVVPKAMKMLDQAQTTMTQASQALEDLDGITDSLNQLVNNSDGSGLSDLDVDGLNESIQDLQKIVKPLANLFSN